MGFGCKVWGFRYKALGLDARIGCRVAGLGFGMQDFGSWVQGFGDLSARLWVLSARFGVFRYKALGLGARIGCRVSDFGF